MNSWSSGSKPFEDHKSFETLHIAHMYVKFCIQFQDVHGALSIDPQKHRIRISKLEKTKLRMLPKHKKK